MKSKIKLFTLWMSASEFKTLSLFIAITLAVNPAAISIAGDNTELSNQTGVYTSAKPVQGTASSPATGSQAPTPAPWSWENSALGPVDPGIKPEKTTLMAAPETFDGNLNDARIKPQSTVLLAAPETVKLNSKSVTGIQVTVNSGSSVATNGNIPAAVSQPGSTLATTMTQPTQPTQTTGAPTTATGVSPTASATAVTQTSTPVTISPLPVSPNTTRVLPTSATVTVGATTQTTIPGTTVVVTTRVTKGNDVPSITDPTATSPTTGIVTASSATGTVPTSTQGGEQPTSQTAVTASVPSPTPGTTPTIAPIPTSSPVTPPEDRPIVTRANGINVIDGEVVAVDSGEEVSSYIFGQSTDLRSTRHRIVMTDERGNILATIVDAGTILNIAGQSVRLRPVSIQAIKSAGEFAVILFGAESENLASGKYSFQYFALVYNAKTRQVELIRSVGEVPDRVSPGTPVPAGAPLALDATIMKDSNGGFAIAVLRRSYGVNPNRTYSLTQPSLVVYTKTDGREYSRELFGPYLDRESGLNSIPLFTKVDYRLVDGQVRLYVYGARNDSQANGVSVGGRFLPNDFNLTVATFSVQQGAILTVVNHTKTKLEYLNGLCGSSNPVCGQNEKFVLEMPKGQNAPAKVLIQTNRGAAQEVEIFANGSSRLGNTPSLFADNRFFAGNYFYQTARLNSAYLPVTRFINDTIAVRGVTVVSKVTPVVDFNGRVSPGETSWSVFDEKGQLLGKVSGEDAARVWTAIGVPAGFGRILYGLTFDALGNVLMSVGVKTAAGLYIDYVVHMNGLDFVGLLLRGAAPTVPGVTAVTITNPSFSHPTVTAGTTGGTTNGVTNATASSTTGVTLTASGFPPTTTYPTAPTAPTGTSPVSTHPTGVTGTGGATNTSPSNATGVTGSLTGLTTGATGVSSGTTNTGITTTASAPTNIATTIVSISTPTNITTTGGTTSVSSGGGVTATTASGGILTTATEPSSPATTKGGTETKGSSPSGLGFPGATAGGTLVSAPNLTGSSGGASEGGVTFPPEPAAPQKPNTPGGGGTPVSRVVTGVTVPRSPDLPERVLALTLYPTDRMFYVEINLADPAIQRIRKQLETPGVTVRVTYDPNNFYRLPWPSEVIVYRASKVEIVKV